VVEKKYFNKRSDGRNLFNEMNKNSNYTVVENTADFRKLYGKQFDPKEKLISLLTDDHLTYDMLRNNALEPSLAEMTNFSLNFLDAASSNDPDSSGFIVMIEGSRIDHCLHENDATCAVKEALAFDRAFEVPIILHSLIKIHC